MSVAERALFLDRDGVINHEVGYLHRAEDVTFVDGIFSLCRTAMALGYRLIIVTNQSGIARGYYSVAQFDGLMDWMRMKFRAEHVELDAVYYCPYHPEHGIGEYRQEHPDRKPAPGMLLRGAAEFGIALEQSIMVGDRCSDIAAANAAGLRQAFLFGATESAPCPGDYAAVATLPEVEAWLLDKK
ncbi:D-glycero-alpha-D-manno-heptose-1,7-bisphosphate 7-phosphatase [Granulicella sibirica]|uniref:D,D-heptose 1,7-bisphosphate phosphatase n=1 Tax=Granulicella sibirica TaxID=2479048 RepID=A0A4Q0T336_9BACT|nr:HAD family hydrolase [Granulicella sibirica]RXH57667.1 D-glycero-D-manno-heptose 1,7-bisphosphate phosphatase [Granulicella sibirica]